MTSKIKAVLMGGEWSAVKNPASEKKKRQGEEESVHIRGEGTRLVKGVVWGRDFTPGVALSKLERGLQASEERS